MLHEVQCHVNTYTSTGFELANQMVVVIALTFSLFKLLRSLVTVKPATENNLSLGVEVAGIANSGFTS